MPLNLTYGAIQGAEREANRCGKERSQQGKGVWGTNEVKGQMEHEIREMSRNARKGCATFAVMRRAGVLIFYFPGRQDKRNAAEVPIWVEDTSIT